MTNSDRICPTCRKLKKLSDFSKDSRKRLGRRFQCKVCHRQSDRRCFMKRRYGISLESYEEMFRAQDGRCAACKQRETAKQKGRIMLLGVDHDHTTGKIRGLLCNRCNRVLGLFRDNPDVIKRALDYVRSRRPKISPSDIVPFEVG